MKYKIGIIEGGDSRGTIQQAGQILDAISKNTTIKFDYRFIKLCDYHYGNSIDRIFSKAAENSKSLDAVLILDDIKNDLDASLNLSAKAASVALQCELELKLFDSLEKYPHIIEIENLVDILEIPHEIKKPFATVKSVAKLIDFVGYQRFGEKIRTAAMKASTLFKESKSKEEEVDFTEVVVDYIDKNVSEPMISSWGEI